MPVFSTVLTSAGDPISVRVHRPEGDSAELRPTVIVVGSWLTVKEQMAGHYATALAQRGYQAITFDYAGFGESGGVLPQTEVPARKIADLGAIVRFTRNLSATAPGGLGLLAVCASAQYALAALAEGAPVASFASVAGWFHDTRSVAAFYGGRDGVAARLALGRRRRPPVHRARRTRHRSGLRTRRRPGGHVHRDGLLRQPHAGGHPGVAQRDDRADLGALADL